MFSVETGLMLTSIRWASTHKCVLRVHLSSDLTVNATAIKVIDFQPLYIFNPKFIQDLNLGAAILKDYIGLTSEKELRAELAKKNEKITKEEAAKKVHLYSTIFCSLF